jgi:hypothetical protein
MALELQPLLQGVPDSIRQFLIINNQSNNTRGNGKVPFVVDKWKLQAYGRNLTWDKEWPARKADNLTAICELIFYKMWDPRSIKSL